MLAPNARGVFRKGTGGPIEWIFFTENGFVGTVLSSRSVL